MGVLAVIKVGGEFRITLPKEVREYLHLTENSEIIFYGLEDMKGRVYIRRGKGD